MKLRCRADRRTMAWAFGLFPAVAAFCYATPALAPWALPLAMYAGFCAGVFAHNHNHCPTLVDRRHNAFFSAWISVFYGYPTFAWIPTHNRNHHRFVDGPGDVTSTRRSARRDTWLRAVTYPFVSAYRQRDVIRDFVRSAKAESPALHRRIVAQQVLVPVAHGGLFALAVALHGWRAGAIAYACSFGVSAATGLWGMMFINYVQHAGCDPGSAFDHSRNFVGRVGNWLVFNSGLHTVHHAHPGAHWSRLPALHAEIAARIDPALCQPSLVGYCMKTYLFGAFGAPARTRRARPTGAPLGARP